MNVQAAWQTENMCRHSVDRTTTMAEALQGRDGQTEQPAGYNQ